MYEAVCGESSHLSSVPIHLASLKIRVNDAVDLRKIFRIIFNWIMNGYEEDCVKMLQIR